MKDFKIEFKSENEIDVVLAYLEENGIKWLDGRHAWEKRNDVEVGDWIQVIDNKICWCVFGEFNYSRPTKTIDDFQVETITFTRVGKRTFGVHVKDGKVQETSIAKCHPEDEFNFKTGCETALDRLYENKIQKGDYVQLRGDLPDEEIRRYILFPFVYLEMKGNIYPVTHVYENGDDRGIGVVTKGLSGITVLPYQRDVFLNGDHKLVLKKSHTELKNGDFIRGNHIAEV